MLKERFLKYLSGERNFSAHTQTAYDRDLQDLHSFISENTGLEVFTPEGAVKVDHRLIRTWMSHLLEQGLSKRSVSRKLAAVSSYFKYLRKTGVVTSNPVARLSAPKAEKKLPSFLREEDASRLFEDVRFPEGWEGLRDRCMLEVLYGCGLRRSELIGLEYRNIDFYNGTLKVLGKGRKERVVPFGSHVREAMKSYFDACTAEGINCRETFFVNESGMSLNPRKVYAMVNKAIASVSLVTRKSPHVLRHSFATHLLNAGADLNAIKELLGHKSLAATQVYVHNSIAKLKSVYKKSHPKA